ncbi:MAG: hypothetical protein NUV94_08065, partial [Candidatus Acetothermia bacterium]|nr:hypothetical protein [Candidatus Acetothermia bacterium]
MNGRNQGERRRWAGRRWVAVVTALALLGLPALANLTRIEAGRFSVRGCDCLRLRIETNGGPGKRVLITIGGNEVTFQTDAQGKADTGYLAVPAGATAVRVELLDKVDEGWPVCCTIPLSEVPRGRYERVPSCMDLAPPTARLRLDPAPTGYGWNRSAVIVILAAGDDKSGPVKICYTLTGAAAQAERCVPFPPTVACGVTPPSVETKFEVSREGVTTVGYHAADGWGNRSATGAGEVRIDLTPPKISGSRSPAANEHGWNKDP